MSGHVFPNAERNCESQLAKLALSQSACLAVMLPDRPIAVMSSLVQLWHTFLAQWVTEVFL